METESIQILWDASHLWGIMVWRALRSFGVPAKLVNAQKITQGSLLGKRVLIVPGGNARQKSMSLGKGGRNAIRGFVEAGGAYIGFCGGAGLALRNADKNAGLNLCPWRRKSFPDKLYHLISGHVRANVGGVSQELPVWWPGKFEPGPGDDIEIVARYVAPGKDLWLADLPLAAVPENVCASWKREGNLDTGLDFPQGQPLLIRGRYGQGEYILSYAHLETPESLAANELFCRLLEERGLNIEKNAAGIWDTTSPGVALIRLEEAAFAHERLHKLMCGASQIGLFFQRTPWLMGWRQGIPGIICNHLCAELAFLGELEPSQKALKLWCSCREDFIKNMDLFLNQAEVFFWNFRLANTIANTRHCRRDLLTQERDRIFGHPMLGGGIAGGILDMLDSLIIASQP